MLLDQWSVIHQVPKGASGLSLSIEHMREQIMLVSPNAKEPKLGNHVTLLPPFRAHPDEMRHFAMGLEIAKALYVGERGAQHLAETHGLDFFRNPGADALIVKVLLPNSYHKLIEASRVHLSRFNEWVFPLIGGIYRPHICILEGNGLYEDVRTSMGKLSSSIFLERFELSFPTIMVKVHEGGTSRWEAFDPNA